MNVLGVMVLVFGTATFLCTWFSRDGSRFPPRPHDNPLSVVGGTSVLMFGASAFALAVAELVS